MISSYRLGDLVMLDLNESEKLEILTDHPHSIASQYILRKGRIQNAITLMLLPRLY